MKPEQTLASCNRTHLPQYPGLEKAIDNLQDRFVSIGNFSHITPEEVSVILADLAGFPLGRHILLSGGSNGMWTDYLISPQEYLTGKSLIDLDLSVIERFFLFNSPTVLAQRELHKKLQRIAQGYMIDGKVFASIPCGLMRDLLSLNYAGKNNISLVGIDIDQEAIDRSKELASKMKVDRVTYVQADAWNLQYRNAFDFICSIGLNMYEKDKSKVIELYRNLFNALRPGGVLFTGVLTWPPYLNIDKSDWDINSIPKYDLHLEMVIHRDILNIKWFNFRTLSEAKEDFRKAGFTNIQIEQDSKCIFPAVIATK